jgi:hypothetical protein
VPGIGDVAVALAAGADAVGSPQVIAAGIKERVAFTLEAGLAGGLPDEESGLLKPAAEMLLLGLALGMGEARERSDTVLDNSGVTDKDHVG